MDDKKEKIFKNKYYDIENGLRSINKLKIDGITEIEKKKLLQNQEPYQINYNTKNIKYIPIVGNPGTYQIDLMFIEKYRSQNHNYGIIMNCINVNTRKAYAYPLKKKDADIIAQNMEKFIKDAGDVKYITTDSGKEFNNKHVKKLTEQHGIIHYFANPNYDKNKMGKIERFHRTLRNLIDRYFIAYKNLNWVDVLDKLIKNYNTTVHRSIKMAPNDVTKKDELKIISDTIKKGEDAIRDFKKFNIGDNVRRLLKKEMFSKGGSKWSEELYNIHDIKGFSFILKNKNGDILETPYKHYQLLKIDDVSNIDNSKKSIQDEIKQITKNIKIMRDLKKDDIKEENILNTKRIKKPNKKYIG